MIYTQKYNIAFYLKPLNIGSEFDMKSYPLHITLADVFAIDRQGTVIENKLTKLIANQHPFTVRAKEDTVLGETKVTLIENSIPLLNLHTQIIDLLSSNGADFYTPKYNYEGFLPHCSIQAIERLNEGDELKIDSVSLIDMFPEGNWQQRKVLATFFMH